ncbi:hypothetical protein RND81_05G241900 [Saponaria officinalis]|uniref:SAC domain-containing protein n=1 Tax=Saponaria officinalis TaxID=3572 RepID=A0AAW1KVZ5_SAPOF
MGSEIEVDGGGRVDGVNRVLMAENRELETVTPYYLDKFTLFETTSNFYIIGRDKERLRWRVLKIARSEPSELVIVEDPTIYSYPQCKNLLQDISELNKNVGGRKFVTDCYGIVGFVRFLGPYYILLITKRKEVGRVCGHPVYSISEYKMIPIPHTNVMSYMNNSERENRCKKLLLLVDIKKDFFFSYSYPIMNSLQKNLHQNDARQSSDKTMFVWNQYLTHHIRNHLKNTLWTVALVHGFFKQVELSAGGKNFLLTLIARRSTEFAGTRYQTRGANEQGQAANDVEIEQIVSQKSLGDEPYKISSAVQNRGSIPLPWSQKGSFWNIKPEILFSEVNRRYEAMQLHFSKLRMRYGDPMILLSLLKSSGKNRRESLLGNELRKAVDSVNMNLEEENTLELLSLDLDAAFRTKGVDVLKILKDEALRALRKIGFFSCRIPEPVNFKASHDTTYLRINANRAFSNNSECNGSNNINTTQEGILRTNCLDSLDRTNVGQYVYSLVALGHQLMALGLTESPELDFNNKLAHELMSQFEALGDAVAQQYGGSAAHSKIFSKTRGDCKASTVLRELIKSMQRHISNSFLDSNKQRAIDLFLGHRLAEDGQSAPLTIDVASNYDSERRKLKYANMISRSRLKRSQSDSDVLYESSSVSRGKSGVSSSESDYSDFRCTTPYASSERRILSAFEKRWYGGLNDIDKADTLSWTISPGYSERGQSEDGWLVADSPASSSNG